MSPDVHAIHEQRPFVGLEQALDGAECARLARPIGAQKAEDLSTVDMQAHPVDGFRGPVGHAEIADIQDGVLSWLVLAIHSLPLPETTHGSPFGLRRVAMTRAWSP